MKGKEPDTYYWQINVSEWRSAKSGRATSAKSSRKPGTTLPTTHKLTPTDTLEGLAKAYYGAYAGWTAIAEANGFRNWGGTTPIMQSKRYKKGGVIKIPIWVVTAVTKFNAPTTGGTLALV